MKRIENTVFDDSTGKVISTCNSLSEYTSDSPINPQNYSTELFTMTSACAWNKLFKASLVKENAVFVENPASEEFAMLRQTMAASLLNCMKYNYDNGQKDFWGYEIGRTYLKVSEADEKNSGVKETQTLAGVITGNIQNSAWQCTGEVDFYTVKQYHNITKTVTEE